MSGGEDCFHCGEPVLTGDRYLVELEDRVRPVCCPGCKAVAEFIRDSGLGDYYTFRTELGQKPDAAEPEAVRPEWLAFDRPSLQERLTSPLSGGRQEATILIEGVRCAACSWLIERAAGGLEGVDEIQVNPATARARLVWKTDTIPLSRLLDTIARLGYQPHPITPDAAQSVALRERRAAMRRLIVAGLGMMQVMTYAVSLYAGAWQGMSVEIREFLRLVSLLVATPVLIYSGAPFFAGAWRDLRSRRPGMDVPVALALGLAYTASLYNGFRGSGEVYFDSVTMFVFFLSLGRFVEMLARHRAGEVADAMARLTPATALRIEPGAAEPVPVAIAELDPGDRVLIRPGDPFPADGVLCRGRAEIDESLLTGESRSISRGPGESVIGGSLNVGDPVEMTVERTGRDTLLSHMTRLLERAQASRPALARSADRIARWFVTGVLFTAAAVTIGWYLTDPALAFPVALSVLVVTCPCALSLATPTALTAATSKLATLGILVTRGDALEKLARADHLVLDKTGTLTEGRIRIAKVVSVGELPAERCRAIAAALEVGSEHPLARAFDNPDGLVAEEVRTLPGRGVEGLVEGRRFRLGSPAFIAGDGAPASAFPADVSVLLAGDDGLLAGFVLADRLRADAPATVATIRQRGLAVEIASGDIAAIVERIADETGIDRWQATLRPEDKLARIQELQADGAVVMMVGDGINDAPVLAGADVSIAMGEGAPLAQSSADMILLGRTLSPLSEGLSIADKTLRVIRQNLGWALTYNLVALPLAAAGLVAPWMAAIGMSASSLVVVLNSTRLGRARGGRRSGPGSPSTNNDTGSGRIDPAPPVAPAQETRT
jgi:Cu2+-exporting ATPase